MFRLIWIFDVFIFEFLGKGESFRLLLFMKCVWRSKYEKIVKGMHATSSVLTIRWLLNEFSFHLIITEDLAFYLLQKKHQNIVLIAVFLKCRSNYIVETIHFAFNKLNWKKIRWSCNQRNSIKSCRTHAER